MASPGPGCASHTALRSGGDVFHHADLYDAADHGQCWGISGVEGEKKAASPMTRPGKHTKNHGT